ncbi:flagellar basal-body rod protein FlgG [Buchnera aphidicola (Ceratoglyphina bambusae)]|uniref:flagellar basal-body rod protein FlgG n=1 Tax=Buchnera aphidicola TaxID=9 RepID=UPI0031B8B179
MLPSMWIAKTGLDAQQSNMNVISNNLANSNTNGFKKSRVIFEDLIYQIKKNTNKNNYNNREENSYNTYEIGSGTRAVSTDKNFSQGNLLKTDSNKDIAINGDGFFKIYMQDGSIYYTRNGSFQINKYGQLVTKNGLLLQSNIIVPENYTKIYINKNGLVNVETKNKKNSIEIGQINLFTFKNNTGLESIGENLYKETSISGKPIENIPGTNNSGELSQGYLETSNVNVAEELINMIQTQRAYEINSKAINISDKMLQRICQL